MKRIFKLLKSQTIKDTMIISLGLGITAIIGFVYTIILARVLGPNTFGIYSAIAALTTIVYSLGDLGISSALINFLPKQAHSRKIFINTSFWWQYLVAIFIIVFFIFAALFNKLLVPGSLRTEILLGGMLTINYLFIGYAQGIFTAERRFWAYSTSQIVDSVIKITFVFIVFKLNKLSISTGFAINIFSTLVALLITFGKELKNIKPEVSRTVTHQLFGFAKWIAVSRLFSVFIGRIDIILLNILASGFATGIFSAANRVTLLFALMVSGLGSVVNSRFSAFDSKEKVISYIKKLLLFISGISLLMLVCVFLAAPIINFVYGSKYIEAIPVFQYLTLAMIPFLFSLITTPAIIYTYNQPGFYAWVTAIQVVVIIAIDIVAIPRFSYFAPVIALGVTNVLVLIISGLKLRSLINGNKILD